MVALERRRGVRLTPPAWVGKVVFPAWILACVLYTAALRDVSTPWAHGVHKALMCLAMAAVWFGYDTYLKPLEGRRLVVLLLPFSFFIFAAQEPLLTILKRVGLHVLGAGDVAMLAVYFGAAILTVVIVVVVGAAVRRYLPTPYAWLTGGRGGRRARLAARPPAQDDAAAEATDVLGEPAVAEAGAAAEP